MHTHNDIADKSNFKKPGTLQPARSWFKNIISVIPALYFQEMMLRKLIKQ